MHWKHHDEIFIGKLIGHCQTFKHLLTAYLFLQKKSKDKRYLHQALKSNVKCWRNSKNLRILSWMNENYVNNKTNWKYVLSLKDPMIEKEGQEECLDK